VPFRNQQGRQTDDECPLFLGQKNASAEKRNITTATLRDFQTALHGEKSALASRKVVNRVLHERSVTGINMTGDPLYWGMVLTFGVIAGLLGYYKADKENFEQGGAWIVLVYLFGCWMGAVVGATIIGPLLQIFWQLLAGSSTELMWPQPVSMKIEFLIAGTWIGALGGLTAVLLWRRSTTTAKR
jgi:hypothetical protein